LIQEIWIAHLTGDLKGDAAMDPDATLPLLPRGACATLGILNVVIQFCFKELGLRCGCGWSFNEELSVLTREVNKATSHSTSHNRSATRTNTKTYHNEFKEHPAKSTMNYNFD
jgi:hypothetical protein